MIVLRNATSGKTMFINPSAIQYMIQLEGETQIVLTSGQVVFAKESPGTISLKIKEQS